MCVDVVSCTCRGCVTLTRCNLAVRFTANDNTLATETVVYFLVNSSKLSRFMALLFGFNVCFCCFGFSLIKGGGASGFRIFCAVGVLGGTGGSCLSITALEFCIFFEQQHQTPPIIFSRTVSSIFVHVRSLIRRMVGVQAVLIIVKEYDKNHRVACLLILLTYRPLSSVFLIRSLYHLEEAL